MVIKNVNDLNFIYIDLAPDHPLLYIYTLRGSSSDQHLGLIFDFSSLKNISPCFGDENSPIKARPYRSIYIG